MAHYTVGFEARKRGAIGKFQIERRTVEAPTLAHARALVIEILHHEGFETRFPDPEWKCEVSPSA